jgi:hypothetical protein
VEKKEHQRNAPASTHLMVSKLSQRQGPDNAEEIQLLMNVRRWIEERGKAK